MPDRDDRRPSGPDAWPAIGIRPHRPRLDALEVTTRTHRVTICVACRRLLERCLAEPCPAMRPVGDAIDADFTVVRPALPEPEGA